LKQRWGGGLGEYGEPKITSFYQGMAKKEVGGGGKPGDHPCQGEFVSHTVSQHKGEKKEKHGEERWARSKGVRGRARRSFIYPQEGGGGGKGVEENARES